MPTLRVLIVEDEMLVAMMLQETLAGEGYEVVGPVGRLQAAMELAGDAGIDVALLDLNLHGEAVYPAARILTDRGIPCVFLTGYGSDSIAAEYRGCAVLSKPFQIGALLDTLHNLLGGTGGTAARSAAA